MKVLIACEFSGIVRDAFIAKGHNAISCDLLPTERPGPHYQGDVRNILHKYWDLIIAHVPCTRLANSGVRWLIERNLWQEMYLACEFFNVFQTLGKSGIRVAIENPIPHKYAKEYIGQYTQIIQPWMFGHGETKATCLWLKNLPKLKWTKETNLFENKTSVEGREGKIWKMTPGPNRGKERSRTYPGIANAMAEQWNF